MGNGSSLNFGLFSVMPMLSISEPLFSEWVMFFYDLTLTLNKLVAVPFMEGVLVAQWALLGKDNCFMSSKGPDKT